MADIQNNSGDGSSAMTALVAILVIVVIGLAVWFGFRGGNAPADNGGGINVELNTPGGSGGGTGGGAGAGY